MSVTATCGGCAKSFVLSEKFYGKKAKCKECGSVFSVPHPSPVAAGSAPAKRSAPPAARPSAAAPSRSAAPVMRSVPKPAAPKKAPPPPPSSSDLDGLDNPDDIYNLTQAAEAPVPKQVFVEKHAGRPGVTGPGVKNIGPGAAAARQHDSQGKLFLILHLVAFGLPILLLLISKAAPGLAPIAGLLALGVGVLMVFAGNIGILIEAGKDGAATVIMCMFIPFYSLYFIFSHMDECKGHLGRAFGGVALIFFAGMMMPKDVDRASDGEDEVGRATPQIVWVREA